MRSSSQLSAFSRQLFVLLMILVGCGEDVGLTATPLAAVGTAALAEVATDTAPAATLPPTMPPTATPIPTPTPVPLVAQVNGEPLTEAAYEARLAQFQQWFPNDAPDGRDMRVYTLENMLTQTLIEQAAAREGISVAPELIEQRVQEAIAQNGGQEGYEVWLEQSRLTPETFYAQLEDELLVLAVSEWVTADVPTAMEYVRARYIQVDDEATAQTIIAELGAGADFATLVQLYSVEPSKDVTNGDLDFFRRGTLLVPEVEAAAFALQPFERSGIIPVEQLDGSTTYYIVETVARDPQRALTTAERAQLLDQRFQEWLTAEREAANIEVYIGFD